MSHIKITKQGNIKKLDDCKMQHAFPITYFIFPNEKFFCKKKTRNKIQKKNIFDNLLRFNYIKQINNIIFNYELQINRNNLHHIQQKITLG